MLKRNMLGASMVEYTIGLVVVVSALVTPIIDVSGNIDMSIDAEDRTGKARPNHISVIEFLERSIKFNYSTYSSEISQPR